MKLAMKSLAPLSSLWVLAGLSQAFAQTTPSPLSLQTAEELQTGIVSAVREELNSEELSECKSRSKVRRIFTQDCTHVVSAFRAKLKTLESQLELKYAETKLRYEASDAAIVSLEKDVDNSMKAVALTEKEIDFLGQIRAKDIATETDTSRLTEKLGTEVTRLTREIEVRQLYSKQLDQSIKSMNQLNAEMTNFIHTQKSLTLELDLISALLDTEERFLRLDLQYRSQNDQKKHALGMEKIFTDLEKALSSQQDDSAPKA